MSTISPWSGPSSSPLPALRRAILIRNVTVNDLYDLIAVLDDIIREAEAR